MQKSQATSRSDRNAPRTNFINNDGSQSQYLEKQLDKLDKLEHNEESKESYTNYLGNYNNDNNAPLTDRDLMSKRSNNYNKVLSTPMSKSNDKLSVSPLQ